MKFMAILLLITLYWQSSISTQSNQIQLSEVNLNLPVSHCPDCRKVIHTIYGYNGCYDWQVFFLNWSREVSHPQFIELRPIPDAGRPQCKSEVQVSVKTLQPTPQMIWIYAKDIGSGELLRCEVRISQVSRIELLTKLRTIDIDDVEQLQVQGFDNEGNVLSLEGFRFEWTITNGLENLDIISYSQAGFKSTGVRQQMENSKMHTDLTLVKAVKTGYSTVSVRLSEKGYEAVAPASVDLSIIEPFVILPEYPIRILTNSQFIFKLARVRFLNNQLTKQEIADPTAYAWVLLEEQLGVIKSDGYFTAGKEEGQSEMQVLDQTIQGNMATTLITVAIPDAIEIEILDVTAEFKDQSLSIEQFGASKVSQSAIETDLSDLPQSNWNLIKEHYYVVYVSIFDNDKNQIMITEDVDISTVFPSQYFSVISSGKSKYLVKTLKSTEQKTEIISTLNHVSNYGLSGKRDAMIYNNVQIVHPTDLILLPYIETGGQIWHMKALGGSGQYTWKVKDELVGVISGQGQVKGVQIGKSEIIVQDLTNPLNSDVIGLEVQQVEMIQWLDEQIEVQAQTEDYLAYMALDEKGRKYTNCTSVVTLLDIPTQNLEFLPHNQKYEDQKQFLKDNLNIVKLKKRFADQPYAMEFKELKQEFEFNEDFELHNNFGVCSISKFRAGELKTFIQGKAKWNQVSSQPLSISVFTKPTNLGPDYNFLFEDIYEKKDKTSEKAHIDSMVPKNSSFILAHGSSLIWTISGANPKWNDFTDQFQVHLPTQDSRIQVQIEKIELNDIKVQVTCDLSDTSDHSVLLKVDMSNQMSRKLLRPKTTQALLKVQCKVPQSLRLMWAQRSMSTTDSFPREYIEDGMRSYYVLNNHEGHVRSLAFDAQQFAFYNYSSTNVDITSEPGHTLLEVKAYDKRRAKFHQTPEIVYMTSKANQYNSGGYISASSFSEVSDTIRVHVVNSVDVYPRVKTLYNHHLNNFDLTLLYGSGKYRYRTNTTDILDVHQGNAKLSLTPKSQGWVEITVTDDAVRDSIGVSAIVLVSDAKRIELLGGGLIQEGGQLELTTKVFDIQNQEFSKKEYIFMEFGWRYETVGRQTTHDSKDNNDLKVATKTSSTHQDEFDFFGYNAGSYRLNAQLFDLNSNIVRIEIFEPITLFPPKLLLYPGAQWTIQTRGGPNDQNSNTIEKRFEIADKTLATIDNYGEVHAHKLGETKILMKVMYNKVVEKEHGMQISEKVEVSQAEIDLEIKLVTSVDLPINQNRIIFKNSAVKLLATLKHGEIPFVHAIGPVSYNWRTNNGEVFQTLLPKSQEVGNNDFTGTKLINANGVQQEFTTYYNYSSIEAQAYQEGDVTVGVEVFIEYPPEYRDKDQLFNKEIGIKVINKISTLVPEYLHTVEREPHLYLLPPNSKNRLIGNSGQRLYFSNTNRVTGKGSACETCQLGDEDVVSIRQDGYIETNDKFGKATITVEENQSLNNQIMMVNILVTNIHSLVVEDSYKTLNMPLGSELSLTVSFQDEHARSFAKRIEGVDLGVAASHPRVIQANLHDYNQTISLKATGSGESNLVLYLEQRPYVLDVIRVKVLSRVWPPSPVYLHLGGEVEFQINEQGSSSKGSNKHMVRWSTNNNDVIEINPLTGRATGLKEGHADVFMSNAVSLQSIVKVLRVGRIDMNDNTAPKYLTNVYKDSNYKNEYILDFKLYLDDQVTELPPVVLIDGIQVLDHKVDFQCHSQNPEIFQSRGIQNPTQGRFSCSIQFLQNHSFISAPSNLLIKVEARNSVDNNSVERIFSIPFHNQFEVDKSELYLEKNDRTGLIKVNSNTDISVSPRTRDLFRYSVLKQSDKNSYHVEVTVAENIVNSFQDEVIVIRNNVSGEEKQVRVQYDNTFREKAYYSREEPRYNYSQSPPPTHPQQEGKSFSSVTSTLMLFLLAIIVVGLAFIYCLQNDKNEQQNLPPRPVMSSNYNSMYPNRSVGGGSSFQSNSSTSPTKRFNNFSRQRF